MAEFASTTWGERLHDAQRQGLQLQLVPEDIDDTGYIYVAGRFLATDAAAEALDLDNQPLVYVNVTSAALAALGLREYSYVDQQPPALPLPREVARLRTQARKGVASADLPRYDVALHYVMTGNPGWVPGGHPNGAPERLPDQASPRSWPNADPLVGIVDTGLDLLSRTGSEYPAVPYLVLDQDSDADALHLPDQPPHVLAAQAGHGTFITWIVGHQSGDRVGAVNVRALDPDGVGSEAQLIAALTRLVTKYPRISIINLSLGGYTDGFDYKGTPDAEDGRPPNTMPLGLGAWIDWFVNDHNPGAVLVCAAGNCHSDRVFWPAAADDPHVIAVASLTDDLVRSTFSNYGPWVDVCTLGDGVVGDHPRGDVVDNAGNKVRFAGQAAKWSGTSFATPVLAAELARRVDEATSNGAVTSPLEVWNNLAATLSVYTQSNHLLGVVWDPRPAGYDPFSL